MHLVLVLHLFYPLLLDQAQHQNFLAFRSPQTRYLKLVAILQVSLVSPSSGFVESPHEKLVMLFVVGRGSIEE